MNNFKRRIAAHGFTISLNVSGALFLAAAVIFLLAKNAEVFSFENLLFFLAAYAFGAILTGVFGLWPWIRIIILKSNGYPFHEGDLVEILVSPNKNEIAKVCEVSASDPRVRIELKHGENTISGFYYEHQLWRVSKRGSAK